VYLTGQNRFSQCRDNVFIRFCAFDSRIVREQLWLRRRLIFRLRFLRGDLGRRGFNAHSRSRLRLGNRRGFCWDNRIGRNDDLRLRRGNRHGFRFCLLQIFQRSYIDDRSRRGRLCNNNRFGGLRLWFDTYHGRWFCNLFFMGGRNGSWL